MLKVPRGVTPAPGRVLVSAQPQKVLSFVGPDLSSPQLRPGTYFTQIYPQPPAGTTLGGCLYTTPNGPELKPLRPASLGRLPVRTPGRRGVIEDVGRVFILGCLVGIRGASVVGDSPALL